MELKHEKLEIIRQVMAGSIASFSDHYIQSKYEQHPSTTRELLRRLIPAQVFLSNGSPEMSIDEIIASCNAMVECGVFKMPYEHTYFQFGLSIDGGRTHHEAAILCSVVAGGIDCMTFLRPQGGKRWATSIGMAMIEANNETGELSWQRYAAMSDHEFAMAFGQPLTERERKAIQAVPFLSVQIVLKMMVMLHTSAFPKAKYAKGKPLLATRKEPIDAYTVVDLTALVQCGIGSVESPSTITERQKVRLHLRRGHVRNQPCGPGRSQIKKIYVEAHLVGYEEQGVIIHDYKVR